MKKKSLIIALLGISILISNAEASPKKLKVLFTIAPTVERALASEAYSYISRELRELKDVEQIKNDPTLQCFFISIFPIYIKLSDGQNVCIAISYVFQRGGITEHAVLVGAPNELKALCEKIVAYFDTYWLEPERKK